MSDILLDINLNLLTELIDIIDQQLDNTIRQSMEVDGPDGFCYFDSAEQITGLGFVVCQTYVATVCGRLLVEKEKALTVGPLHPSGQAKVKIVNHAANYWKHNGEWPLDRSPKRRMIIEAAFESIGFPVDTEYPLSGVLTEVASPESAGFKPVIAALELWKNELSKTTQIGKRGLNQWLPAIRTAGLGNYNGSTSRR